MNSEQAVVAAEALYGIALRPREHWLLTQPGSLLSPIEKQQAYILRMALSPVPCPACGLVTCQYAAMPEDESTLSCPDDAYHCPRCDVPVIWHLAVNGQQFFTIDLARYEAGRGEG